MPIFSFGLMVKDTFLSTRGRFSLYRISAFSKTTSPSCGQSRGGVLFLIRAGASRESVLKKKTKTPRSSVSSKQNTRKESYLWQLSPVLPCRLRPYQLMAVLLEPAWLEVGPVVQKFAVLYWTRCYSPLVSLMMTLVLLHNTFLINGIQNVF